MQLIDLLSEIVFSQREYTDFTDIHISDDCTHFILNHYTRGSYTIPLDEHDAIIRVCELVDIPGAISQIHTGLTESELNHILYS